MHLPTSHTFTHTWRTQPTLTDRRTNGFSKRVCPRICSDHFQKLESVIRPKLLPAVCNRTPSDVERELIGLPTRLGGLGVHVPAEIAKSLHQGAVNVMEPLVDHILQHQNNRHDDDDDRKADPAFEEALGHQRDAVKQARQAFGYWHAGESQVAV